MRSDGNPHPFPVAPGGDAALVSLPDRALLDAVLARSERAWGELLRRFRPLMFRCIHKVATRHQVRLAVEDESEIFAEVCINLLRDDRRKLRAWDPARGCKLSTWLGLLAMNTASDFLRVGRRRRLLDRLDSAPEHVAPAPSALDELLDRERLGYLAALLSDCSDRERRFVDLYFRQGLRPSEVARAMHISVKTVYSKKQKVRAKLEALARRDREEASRPGPPHPPPRRPSRRRPRYRLAA